MTVTCSHGLSTGICLDDMTPDAREAFDFTYRHAYEFACGQDEAERRDEAENYASWYVRTYFVDSLEDGPNHRDAWLRFKGVA